MKIVMQITCDRCGRRLRYTDVVDKKFTGAQGAWFAHLCEKCAAKLNAMEESNEPLSANAEHGEQRWD